MSPLVELRDLHVVFPRRRGPVAAVKGLDLTIEPGEAVGLVGESGSGKSVTVRTLLGLTGRGAIVEAERLTVCGQDGLRLSGRAWRDIRGSQIGLVLQDALISLDPLRPVGQEIGEALRLHQRLPAGRRRQRVIELLSEVGVPAPEIRARQRPHELSGGLRQRALIASAIAGQPALIIADEPTTALDVTVQAQVLALLDARRRAGAALLLVSHDLAVVASICDRVIVMKDGAMVERGPSRRVLTRPSQPYTKRLLAAVPSAASRGWTLSSPQRQPLPARTVDPAATVLAANGLSHDFKAPDGQVCHAVRDVSLRLAPAETLGVVGESGSGKSTLAKILAGLLEPSQGRVDLDGQPWAPASDRWRRSRRRQVQLIAQDALSSFDPRHSAAQVLTEALRHLGLDPAQRRRRIASVLELVDLSHLPIEASPRTFSGGERQRLAIARALIVEPRVLVADEPVSALDVSVQAQILDLLARVQARTEAALVFISHDLGVVHHLADRVVVMKDGRAVEQGPADQVFLCPSHPYTRDLVAALPRLPEPAPEPLASIPESVPAPASGPTPRPLAPAPAPTSEAFAETPERIHSHV
ncbi:MAG: ABC transporter ATP-binding protein [Propionibacteriaceae bacterium]|jgi:peptide/nickel transport system ATP-binding protein|nr:ABC transporter ATP-binding protein [Propionibacteriaceae bacterium]